MDTIILTGGRGKRLGALTMHQPKANLRFARKSLLAHTLSALNGSEDFIERICIATGYRANKIESQYRHDAVGISSKIPITFLPVEPQPKGTFGSAVWALRTAKTTRPCLILGIDVIVTQRAMAEFIAHIRNEARTTFMVSAMLAVAPTHGRIHLNGKGEIVEYRKSSLCAQAPPDDWYCDVGVRYFSADFVKECQSLSFTSACDFDDIVPPIVDKGRVFESHVLNERWLHFAHSRDFLQKPL